MSKCQFYHQCNGRENLERTEEILECIDLTRPVQGFRRTGVGLDRRGHAGDQANAALPRREFAGKKTLRTVDNVKPCLEVGADGLTRAPGIVEIVSRAVVEANLH